MKDQFTHVKENALPKTKHVKENVKMSLVTYRLYFFIINSFLVLNTNFRYLNMCPYYQKKKLFLDLNLKKNKITLHTVFGGSIFRLGSTDTTRL
jgi:hypothetical protein